MKLIKSIFGRAEKEKLPPLVKTEVLQTQKVERTAKTAAGLNRPKLTKKQIDFGLNGAIPLERESEIEDLESLATQPFAGYLHKKHLSNAGYEYGITGKSDHVVGLLDLSCQCGVAHYRSSQQQGVSTVRYKGKSYDVVETDKPDFNDPSRFCSALEVAIVLRDRAAIEYLVTVPESHLRTSTTISPEFHYAYAAFLQALYQPNADIGEALAKWSNALMPDQMEDWQAGYADLIHDPALRLFRLAFSSDPDGFNTALDEAVGSHKKFWNVKENNFDSEGWFAWPILAACVIAQGSKGYPIEVSSNYLPRWLLDADFEVQR